MATVGEAIIEIIESYGIQTVFGIPGVHTVELYRGLATSGISHVTPRHEQGAGFMADGYWRATGRVAACFIITGPGLTNILTPMAQAYADSVPMLVISAVNRRPALGMGRGDLHEVPNQGVIAGQAAAFSHRLTDPTQLPEVLARAFAVFRSARPRPVHIEVPVDMFADPFDGAALPLPDLGAGSGDSTALEAAAAALAAAERPLILAGGGAVRAAAGIQALAERLDAPVVMTINGRGILAMDHPLAVSASASLRAVRTLAAEADVVLAIGTELGKTDYDIDLIGPFEVAGTLIRIEIDAEQMLRNQVPGIALVGDATASVKALLARLGAAKVQQSNPGGTDAGSKRAAACLQAARAEVSEGYRRTVTFLDQIRTVLPDAPIVGDSTQPIYAGNMLYGAPGPRRWFNSATGYGALGYGLPGAVGAAKALGAPVVCLAGDGGLQFSLGDLGTAVEESLPVIVIVWNNRGYGEIKAFMEKDQVSPIGVDMHTPDFVALAQAYGVPADRLDARDQLPDLLRAAAGRSGPSLIEIDEALVLAGVPRW